MYQIIISEIKNLANEKNRQKHINEGCDLEVYGVKIGDLKQLIKKYQLNNNNELAIELMESKIYDAMYLAFMIMQPSNIDSKYLIKWIDYSTYYKIRIHSLAYAMAEHSEYEFFINYLKPIDDDLHQSIYYALLAGRIIIDPTYNHKLILDECTYIRNQINSVQYTNYNYTKLEMNALIGYVGIQVAELSELMIEYYNEYSKELTIESSRKIANQANFIEMAMKRGGVGRSRKSARC